MLVLLGSFEVCDSGSFHDSPHLIASVSHNTDISHDTADLISQLSAHFKVLDFPTAKSRLLDLLSNISRLLLCLTNLLVSQTVLRITIG